MITESIESLNELNVALKMCYKMTDMGELSKTLTPVVRDKTKNCVFIRQEQKYCMEWIKPIQSQPQLTQTWTTTLMIKPVNRSTYQSITSRPGIAQAVSVIVSKFSAGQNTANLTAVKRIPYYLKGTVNFPLKFEWESGTLVGFSDADWAGHQDDRNSTTGNVFLVDGGAVSWLSKNQSTVALFSLWMDATPSVILEDNNL